VKRRRRTSLPIRCLQMVGTALALAVFFCVVEAAALAARWISAR
jgi:hypothetical protein